MKLIIDITDAMYQAVKSGLWSGSELWYNALNNGVPFDDAKYHEEHGEVVITDDIWEDANKAFLYKQKHRSMVEDIRAEIQQLYTNARKADICEQMGLKIALDVIDRHMKGGE